MNLGRTSALPPLEPAQLEQINPFGTSRPFFARGLAHQFCNDSHNARRLLSPLSEEPLRSPRYVGTIFADRHGHIEQLPPLGARASQSGPTLLSSRDEKGLKGAGPQEATAVPGRSQVGFHHYEKAADEQARGLGPHSLTALLSPREAAFASTALPQGKDRRIPGEQSADVASSSEQTRGGPAASKTKMLR